MQGWIHAGGRNVGRNSAGWGSGMQAGMQAGGQGGASDPEALSRARESSSCREVLPVHGIPHRMQHQRPPAAQGVTILRV